jgi:hypothetical protein
MSLDQRAVRSCSLHRRRFLLASATLGAALLIPGAARAASVRELQGSVKVNGERATAATRVGLGDVVETGPDSKLVFVVGQDAFLLRELSSLTLERPTSSSKVAVASLRLDTGALLAAFGKGRRLIETATARASIRGTGVYIEASAEQTYFCTCYGVVELRDKAGKERKLVVSGYHTPNMIYAHVVEARAIAGAVVKDHTDQELIMLDALVARTSPMVERNRRLKQTAKQTQPEHPPREPTDQASATQPPAAPEPALPPPGPPASGPQAPPSDMEYRLPPPRLD